MGFLTIPSVDFVKGNTYSFTVNKIDLAAIDKVSNDAYFSNSINWYKLTATYRSSNNKDHIEIVNFDPALPSPLGDFKVSSKAIGSFRILDFTLYDHDGGKLVLNREDLVVDEYDISMPLKIAPSQLVINVGSQTQFDVTDGSNYLSGFKVILFNIETNSFEADEPREISSVIGNIVHLKNAFVTTVVANKHRLRFPNINKCNNIQATEYYFNSLT